VPSHVARPGAWLILGLAIAALAGVVSGRLTPVHGQTAGPALGLVPVVAGWNLVAIPPGTRLNPGAIALYTWQPADLGYEAVRPGEPIISGYGYWAYFNSTAALTLPIGSQGPYRVVAQPGQWVMIGDPSGITSALVGGADALVTYDAASGQYRTAGVLSAGQGGWALSVAGGPITVAPLGLKTVLPPVVRVPASAASSFFEACSVATYLDSASPVLTAGRRLCPRHGLRLGPAQAAVLLQNPVTLSANNTS